MRPSITPLEIRKRVFKKSLRGLDDQDVHQYLEAIAEDIEELTRSLDELERENARLKEENERYRGNESTLKETLVLAQKSAEGLRVSTEKEAERRLYDAERQADLLMQQALDRVTETETKIRDLRLERRNFHLKLQGMLDMFQQVLNFDREEEELDSSVAILRQKRRESEAG
jgi:cell division initiation protein